MKSFNFNQPTQLRFGWGRLKETGKIVSRVGKKCLLVTEKPIPVMKYLFEKIKDVCTEAGMEVIHFDGVVASASTDCINAGSKMAADNGVDVVLGVGGGSSIDSAKGIAIGATHEGDIWQYRLGGEQRVNRKNILPIVAIPTTAGTGAEVTNMSVIKNESLKTKSALAAWEICPKVAIIDPELTTTMPSHLTASTGFDVFAHAFECTLYQTVQSHHVNLIAYDAIKLVIEYLPIAVENGDNKEAREALSFAATQGGLAISNCGTVLSHSIDMAIGGHVKNIMHGEALALMYPAINKWTWEHAIKEYAKIGRMFNPSLKTKSDKVAAEKACIEMDNFLKTIGMYLSFEEKGVPESELEAIANDSFITQNYKFHPIVATKEDVLDLLKKSYRR
ncbi:MAG: iron-containing alcohol dehydrogenase [Candidatus Lokiarchaeota archaeon]|nr:iron-containing alcohol dehydrogenase [Candidatus Lokiarchaeota archaeon]